MSDQDDDGMDPIETEPFLGSDDSSDDGLTVIETEWEQRSDDPPGHQSRG